MSCNRNKLACLPAATSSGIGKTAGSAANGLGAAAKQIGQWVKDNPREIVFLAETAAAIAVYQKKKEGLTKEEGQLPMSGVAVSLERSGGSPATDQDRKLAKNIDDGMSQVLKKGVASDIGVRKLTIADDFAFANKYVDLRGDELSRSGFIKKAYGHVYRAIKPYHVGNAYITIKTNRFLGAQSVASVGDSRKDKTDEVVIASNNFSEDDFYTRMMNKKMGGEGQYARYQGAVLALNKAPRVKKPRGPFAQTRQNIYTDAIASRLIAPKYKGRRLYGLCVRVADWNARRIAEKTGDDPLAVLARKLGTQA